MREEKEKIGLYHASMLQEEESFCQKGPITSFLLPKLIVMNTYSFLCSLHICMWNTSASFTWSYYRELNFLAQCQILINQNINMKQISLVQCGQMHTLFCLYANLPICIKWRLHVCNNQRCSIFYEDHCRIYL